MFKVLEGVDYYLSIMHTGSMKMIDSFERLGRLRMLATSDIFGAFGREGSLGTHQSCRSVPETPEYY